MKLQIMSDLHFEMHADGGAELIRELDPTGVDVLVLAGDITMARHYEDLASVFKPLARKYRHILYVPGNHEYYKSSPREVARNLAKLTKEFPEVVMPENDSVVIAGQRFIAGTMWFRPDPTSEPNKRFMLDLNRAYNPPCAFSEFTTCPLPPRQNKLQVKIEAGEKYPPLKS
jgi:predicted phosphohydrolase